MGEWRAGRRVRLPVELHRPARFLDEGVPDAERALQMRGTSLVGTVKSGALVEVLGRGSWIEEKVGRRARADAPARDRRCRRSLEPAVRGDRDGDCHRRSRRPGRGGAAAAAGGRHLPRDRDLGRQHRDSRRPDDRRIPVGGPARAHGDDRVDRLADRLRLSGGRRRVGRSRDADGRGLLRRAGGRSAQPAAQRAGVCGRGPGRRTAAVGGRSGVRADLRRHARHSDRRAGGGVAPRAAPCRSARRAAGGVGGDRGAPLSGWRAAVFARDVCRPRPQFSRDPADGGCAGGRDGRRARRVRLAMAGDGLRLCRAPWSGGPRAVRGPGSLCADGDVQGRASGVARRDCLLRGAGRLVALRLACRCRGGGGRRVVDAGGAVGARGRSRRRPASRHVSRRRAGRLGFRALSARRHAAR